VSFFDRSSNIGNHRRIFRLARHSGQAPLDILISITGLVGQGPTEQTEEPSHILTILPADSLAVLVVHMLRRMFSMTMPVLQFIGGMHMEMGVGMAVGMGMQHRIL